MMMSEFSVVIPARNEAKTIGAIVSDLLDTYPLAEVIVVNDGSEDDTADIASNAGAIVISHPYSLGNGAAIKAGVKAASTKYVVLMDGDGQHNTRDVHSLVTQITLGYDLVVGARTSRKQHSSLWRWIANSLYNNFASLVTNTKVIDLTSGFRAVDREKFLGVIHLLPNGFSYPTTSTLAFLRSGHQVLFAPVNVKAGANGSHINPLRDGFRFLLIIFKIVMLYSPFKVLAPLAFLQVGVGLVMYLPGLFSGSPVFTNGMAFLFSGGVVTLAVSILSEQLTVLLYK